MANQEHLDLLKQGVEIWNQWRLKHVATQIGPHGADLRGADLTRTDLRGADLTRTDLTGATLSQADLTGASLIRATLFEATLTGATLSQAHLLEATLRNATLTGADLTRANLTRADLTRADLTRADLGEAYLIGATLTGANLIGANLIGATLIGATLRNAALTEADLRNATLTGADLNRAILVGTNFTDAILTGCHIYGIAAWNVELTGATQNSLIITPEDEPEITVDNLKIAQFIYLLLNNKEIRDVIDTITSKVVLILGRFTQERKKVLDALRDELRKHNYTSVLFDFEKPASRDFTETVRTLAHLARFIVADLTDPSSIPQELQAIVPDLEVPIQPLLLEAKREYAMFLDFKKYHWVLPVSFYKDLPSLLASLNGNIIDAAEKKVAELALEKAKRLERP